MDYKKLLYQNYGSTHNKENYTNQTVEKLQERLPVYDFYYGKLIPKDKKSQILDIGCGDGNFLYYLNEKGYSNAKGIDLSEEEIKVAKKLGIKGAELGDIHVFLKAVENKFDCIIARDVIEHFTREETFKVLFKVFKALKPGGSFIMQVPNGEGIYYTSIYFGDYTHENAYSWKSVSQIFLNIGFQNIQSFPVEPYNHGFKGKVRSFLWRLKTYKTRFWKMVETGSGDGIFTSNLIAIGHKPTKN